MPTTEIVSIEQVRGHLNITTTGSDSELTYFKGVAEALVQEKFGQFWIDATYTDERYKGGRDAVVLLHPPVVEIVSLTNDGSEIDPEDYTLDADTGLIRLIGGRFAPGEGNVGVTYGGGAGEGDVPPIAQHCVLETLRHLWDTQRGGAVRSARVGDEYAQQPTTYSLPLRVVELIDSASISAGIG